MKLADVVGGVRVHIIGSGDVAFPSRFKGRVGRVCAFDTGGLAGEPMIKVAVKGFGTGWFWLEELELA